MPFVQRVIQPINISQVWPGSVSSSGQNSNKNENPNSNPNPNNNNKNGNCCKCRNDNCAVKQQQHQHRIQPQQLSSEQVSSYRDRERDARELSVAKCRSLASFNVKDTLSPTANHLTRTTTVTVHANGNRIDNNNDPTTVQIISNPTNASAAAAISSSPIAEDLLPKNAQCFSAVSTIANNEEQCNSVKYEQRCSVDSGLILAPTSTTALVSAQAPAIMSMKKLKQHVEFQSTISSSPTRRSPPKQLVNSPTHSNYNGDSHPATSVTGCGGSVCGGDGGSCGSSRRRGGTATTTPTATPTSPLATANGMICAGYEFDSISNITLSNALRQLASLVLIASEIFGDLQQELQSVGERARHVQKKINAVEQRLVGYDPKTVQVRKYDLKTSIKYNAIKSKLTPQIYVSSSNIMGYYKTQQKNWR